MVSQLVPANEPNIHISDKSLHDSTGGKHARFLILPTTVWTISGFPKAAYRKGAQHASQEPERKPGKVGVLEKTGRKAANKP